jgi:ribosome-binding ATPase YchF (GTP1/OBG family)
MLTAKPLLTVVNVGEERVSEVASFERGLNAAHSRHGRRIVVLCGKLEMELAQLDEETAASWRQEFDLTESGTERIVDASYQLMGLVTFFSTASDEVRAWPVPRGTATPAAAGRIHSDMERGFIRAEVVGYDDLLACGGLTEARHRGLLRTEGRNYLVADGDVITFLFNV